jgi:hypothetical protein
MAVGKDQISDTSDLKRELRQAESKGVFVLTIERGGQKTQVVIR